MDRLRTFTLLAASALLACALVPGSALAITRSDAVARGKVWLNAVRVNPTTKKATIGVPYSQSKWALENGSVPPTSTPYADYRTDCSGFVSLCWDLHNSSKKPYSTSTYEMGKNNSPYFKLTAIKQSELLPGDVLLKSTVWYTGSGGGHVILFAGWSKSDMSEYWALEQTGPGTKYSKRPWGQTGYRAFRYNGIEGFNRTRVTYGSTFTVYGTAYRTPNASGSVVATGGAVDLAFYGSDGSVSYVASNIRVDGNGHYSITYAPTKTGRFAVRYRSLDVANQSSVLPATTVTVAPYVTGVDRNSSTLRRGRTYLFSGSVNPRINTTLKIYKYNTRRHTYALYKNVRASIGWGKGSKGYGIGARWRPSTGKYRLSWLTATPSGMSSSASASRYITVK